MNNTGPNALSVLSRILLKNTTHLTIKQEQFCIWQACKKHKKVDKRQHRSAKHLQPNTYIFVYTPSTLLSSSDIQIGAQAGNWSLTLFFQLHRIATIQQVNT